MLAITHYNRLLAELRPDRVHILVKGHIVAAGGPELADELETAGYAAFSRGRRRRRRPTGRAAVRPGSLDELFSTR